MKKSGEREVENSRIGNSRTIDDFKGSEYLGAREVKAEEVRSLRSQGGEESGPEELGARVVEGLRVAKEIPYSGCHIWSPQWRIRIHIVDFIL